MHKALSLRYESREQIFVESFEQKANGYFRERKQNTNPPSSSSDVAHQDG
jgi:hypothetical protein